MQITSAIDAHIIQQIGALQGRNSSVFLAWDPQLNGNIALKEIPIFRFNNVNDYFKEAKILYENKHPRVAPILYACTDVDKVRIAMPYFGNGSLQDHIASRPLTVRKIIEWGQQFLSGLHHVHINGYIHYDVKPSNILIADDGSAMITDFGQSQKVNAYGVANNPLIYIYHFAPENLQQSTSTIHSDIYQCGLTMYRMCNGEPFFNEQKNAIPRALLAQEILSGRFPNRDKFLPHIPRRLKLIIRKALAMNPADRFPTAHDLSLALSQVGNNLDWQYEDNTTTKKWSYKNMEHVFEIVLQYNNIGKCWEVNGTQRRISDGLTRRKNAWSGAFRTQKQANSFVDKIFKEMER